MIKNTLGFNNLHSYTFATFADYLINYRHRGGEKSRDGGGDTRRCNSAPPQRGGFGCPPTRESRSEDGRGEPRLVAASLVYAR